MEVGVMTTKVEVGDYVKVKYGPNYWDEEDNMEAWDDGDGDSMDPDDFPGFNSDMDAMIGNTYQIKEIHKYRNWVKLTDEYGYNYWFHTDWLIIETVITLNEIDNASPHRNVIIKIKKMEAKFADRKKAPVIRKEPDYGF